MPITSKKQKFIGVQEYINKDTGEIVPMQVVSVEERDFNFHKVWMQHLINSLSEISNVKTKVAFWIIDHLNRENQLIYTQRAIAEATGISLETVRKTMNILQRSDPPFLTRINSGAYMINPNVLFKGTHNARMGICFDYSKNLIKEETEQKGVKEHEEN